ncbi:DUF6491 family protein [Sphingomonas sp. DT-204]|uniref:DUF6491 family protein n=1 Tax=Sphingomonas sp. DT-204 TaxID=3396166 RepID=UPI003F1DED61
MPRTLIALATLAVFAVPAAAQQAMPDRPKEDSIPFVQFGNIRDFEADGDRGIYLQNRARQWYHADLNGPCTTLPFATRIAVDTRFAGDRLDNSGRIYVDGQACWISSLTKSGPPPKRQPRKR